jgi:hypothetical protein
MMRRSELRRVCVAAVLVVAMMLTVTGLLGAPGAVVKLTSPKAGARVSGEIELAAAVKASAKVSYVIFGVDGDRPYSTNSSPYRFRLDTAMLPDGVHRVFAEAYDDFGLIGSSKAITIVVKNTSGIVVAKKAAAERVASKPPAARAQAGAKAPIPPATNVAAHPATFPGPRTVASVDEATARSLASPTALGGGPAPEPSRVADARASGLAQARELVAGGYRGSAVGVVSTLPAARTAAEAAMPRAHTIVLNGEVVAFDVSPMIKDGRLQAGFRALFTQTRARVFWIAERRTARSVTETLTVEVPVGSRVASVNGAAVDMGATAEIREGRTMIPIRFFAAATGSALSWDSKTRVAALKAGRREVARSGSSG